MRHFTSRRLHVLVTTTWLPGGTPVWAHEFANHLAERGYDVHCLYVRPWGIPLWSPPKFQRGRYQAIYLQVPVPLFLIAVPFFLHAFRRPRRVDVVISSEMEGSAIPATARRGSIHHVAAAHTPEPSRVGAWELLTGGLSVMPRLLGRALRPSSSSPTRVEIAMPWYWQWVHYFGQRRLNNAPTVVCVSDHQRRQVERSWRIDPRKVRVISDGIDTDRFHPAAPPPSPEDPPRVLYAGGPRWLKGADLALQAFARAAHQLPRASLDMVGGFNWGAYERIAETLGIRDRVRFHPYVAYEVMQDFYARSTVCLAPSRGESFGRTAAEAMACGRPVISTSVASIPEIIDHGLNGILVPGDDVDALASALIDLVQDQAVAERLGRAAREKIEDQFAWPRVIDQWEELLAGLS